MSLTPRRPTLCLTASAFTLLAVASQAGANSPGGYLTWQGKTNAPQQQPSPQYPSNPVPPSPYGQVGNPFVQTLNWPTKSRPNAPAPQAAEQPHQALASVSVPVPLTQPAPVAVMQLPPPPPRVTVPTPQPSQQPEITPQPAAATAPRPQPQAQTDVPPVAPPVPIVATAPARPSQPAAADAGYQVPMTSKYAARIASARAAAPVAAPQATASVTPPAAPCDCADAAPAPAA